jgi:hypothetical protein
MGENDISGLQEQIDQINERLDPIIGEKIRREAEEVRSNNQAELYSNRELLETCVSWLRETNDGWILVKRDDTSAVVALPSHLKVSLTSSAGGRDNITVLEGLFTGLKANLTKGFMVTTNPQHGTVAAVFSARVGGPIVIGGETYDKQIVLNFDKAGVPTQVGPHPAKTHPTNPVPSGTHVMEIPDFPHPANPDYGPLRTVWFRIGTSGDRYVHPGRVSLGCITCAPPNWAEIYDALAKGRKNGTAVGDVRVQP